MNPHVYLKFKKLKSLEFALIESFSHYLFIYVKKIKEVKDKYERKGG